MIPAGDAIEYRRLRAPGGHGQRLVDPPLDDAPDWLDRNRRSLDRPEPLLFGRTWRDWNRDVRRDLVSLALDYVREYRDPLPLPSARPLDPPPLVLTGHQPQLFHPGVWYKNFALSAIARQAGAIAVNLLIDNDTLRAPVLKTPAGTPDRPQVELLAYDRPAPEVPFEQRMIVDPPTFESFGARAAERLRTLIPDPLLTTVWPTAVSAARRTRSIGRSLAQARHELERSWGLESLELPLGRLCDASSFRRFLLRMLDAAGPLRNVYNGALAEYRAVHRIHSRSHPVPNLALEDGWIEAPFWIWTDADPRRRRLFVRRQDGRLEVTDRQQFQRAIDLPVDADDSQLDPALALLARWSAEGVRLRSRALTTTLFARLFASDLFLHGIGGAKYDQLTDALIRRFFGVAPPAFITLTLSARLPVPHEVVTPDDVRRSTSLLRDLRFHPERFVDGDLARVPEGSVGDRAAPPVELVELAAAKRRLLAEPKPPRGAGRARHQTLQQLNRRLEAALDWRRVALLELRDRQSVLAARHALLASREYSFCLFPAETLRPLLESASTLGAPPPS